MEQDMDQLRADYEQKHQSLRRQRSSLLMGLAVSVMIWLVTITYITHKVKQGAEQFDASIDAMKKQQAEAVKGAGEGAADAMKLVQPILMGVGYALGYRDAQAGNAYPADVIELMKYYIATEQKRTAGQSQ